MDTVLGKDLFRADALKRHHFGSIEKDHESLAWLDGHRRATGGETCWCGLPERNRRHFKTRRRPAR